MMTGCGFQLILMAGLGFSGTAQATLNSLGVGLIYVDVLNVTCPKMLTTARVPSTVTSLASSTAA